MKPTNKSLNGTSFHMSTVSATVNELKQVLGEVRYTGDFDDKVQNEWLMELKNGDVFSVYDWKEYKQYSNDDVIEWHIGGHDRTITERAKQQIIKLLNEKTK
jgi:hypothetical protein